MVAVQKYPSKHVLLLPTIPTSPTRGWIMAHALTVVTVGIVIRAALQFANATDAMAFYGVYHRDPWNQLIHFWGVPVILWTMMTFQAHLVLTQSVVLEWYGMPAHYPTWATLSTLFYLTYYLRIDEFGALLYAPIWYGMYWTSVHWVQRDQQRAMKEAASPAPWSGTGSLLQWVAVFHVLAWYVQIHPGHRILEGAQPAIGQSVGGALLTAPMFALYEGIWYLGWRRDFQLQVLALVDSYTEELCASGNVVMRACTLQA